MLTDPDSPALVLEFAVRHLVPERPDLEEALVGNPRLPDNLRRLFQSNMLESNLTKVGEKEEDSCVDPERRTPHQKVSRMTVLEKINTALMDSQEERAVLVRDSNKIVARAVAQSPKLSDREAENIATIKNVSEEVLRLIATTRNFIKNYKVTRNLISNPRTLIDVGLPLIGRLNNRDPKELSRNKNVAELIKKPGFQVRQAERGGQQATTSP